MTFKGFPVGRKNSASFEKCPKLDLPIGASEIKCNGATCALVCNEGSVVTGRKRIRCRQKPNGKFHWRKTLGQCVSCDPIETQGP